MATTKQKTRSRKKVKKVVKSGLVHVSSTFNNTIVSFSDVDGNVISQGSSGSAGFRGSRKSTPYAASQAATRAAEAAKVYGFESANVLVRGIGSGRESAIRSVQAAGIVIKSIRDITPVPHNGCRPRKPRRG
jgi:small subunit ribosomal protein S11